MTFTLPKVTARTQKKSVGFVLVTYPTLQAFALPIKKISNAEVHAECCISQKTQHTAAIYYCLVSS